jgi:hypothetical protein
MLYKCEEIQKKFTEIFRKFSSLWLDQLNVFPVHYKRIWGLGDGVKSNAIAEATHAVAA